MFRIATPVRPGPAARTGLTALLLALAGAGLPADALGQDVGPDPMRDRQEAEVVTYRDALRIAVQRNTDVLRARDDAALQGLEATGQAMDFLPTVELSSGATRTFGRSFSQQEGEILSQTSDFVDVGGSASLQLFNGFEKWSSLEQAQREEEASRLQVDRARRSAVFEVVDRFATLLQNRELTRVRQQELEAQEDLLRQVRGLVEVGRRPRSDLYQQQAARAEARQALVEARRQERLAETELIRLLQLDPMGTYRFEAPSFSRAAAPTPDSAAATPDSTAAMPDSAAADLDPATAAEGAVAAADSFALDSLLRAAFEQRSDLAALRSTVEARRQGVQAAQSGNWPSLSLSFDYGSDWSGNAERPVPGTGSSPRMVTLNPDDGSDPVTFPVPGTGSNPETFQPDFLDQIQDRRGGAVRLSMSIPVFDGYDTKTQIRGARVQLDNARYDLRDQRQTVAFQVRQALLDYRSARAQRDATEQRLEAARRAREAARRRYELGAATFVELTQAISTFVSARSANVRARYARARARKLIDYQTGTLEIGPGSRP